MTFRMDTKEHDFFASSMLTVGVDLRDDSEQGFKKTSEFKKEIPFIPE